MRVWPYPGGDHYMTAGDRRGAGEGQLEPGAGLAHPGHRVVKYVRHQSLGVPIGVCEEAFQAQRATPGNVLEAVRLAEAREVVSALRRREMCTIRFGFKEHALRHVRT